MLFGLATLHINQQVQTATTVTQRALFLDLPGDLLDVVIGQSSAGASCDAPVSIASVIKRTEKPTKAEVRKLRHQIEKAVAKEKASSEKPVLKPAPAGEHDNGEVTFDKVEQSKQSVREGGSSSEVEATKPEDGDNA